MKLINLLPQSENKELKLTLLGQQLINFWIYVGISLAVFFVLALAVTLFLRSEIARNNGSIENKKRELASSNTQQLEARVVGLNDQIRGINNLKANQYLWSKVFIELSRITPEGVTLNVVDADRVTAKIEVTGNAKDRQGVIDFWSNVKKSPYFRNINFPFANLEEETNAEFEYAFYVNIEMIKNEGDN